MINEAQQAYLQGTMSANEERAWLALAAERRIIPEQVAHDIAMGGVDPEVYAARYQDLCNEPLLLQLSDVHPSPGC